MNIDTGLIEFDRVTQFVPGNVYVGGSMDVFTKLTKWPGYQVRFGSIRFCSVRFDEASETSGGELS